MQDAEVGKYPGERKEVGFEMFHRGFRNIQRQLVEVALDKDGGEGGDRCVHVGLEFLGTRSLSVNHAVLEVQLGHSGVHEICQLRVTVSCE